MTGKAEVACRPAPAGQAAGLIGFGGSFLAQVLGPIANCGLFDHVEQFAYYTRYRMVYPEYTREPVDRAAIDWEAVLRGRPVILLELNERTIDISVPWMDELATDLRAAGP